MYLVDPVMHIEILEPLQEGIVFFITIEHNVAMTAQIMQNCLKQTLFQDVLLVLPFLMICLDMARFPDL